MQRFGESTRTWFERTFHAGPTAVQRRGWEAIATGGHALLVAPTGSGKTLAAFLWAIDRLAQLDDAAAGTRVLYVSPLKALVYDVERNLRAPLAGVEAAARELGSPIRAVRVGVRTGDTLQRERARQLRDPAEILVTTPESLYLLLGSRAREGLRTVTTVIVDEIHALAPTKRGAHLALSLERLAEMCERDPQRIGLSATVRPADAVARFLGGDRPVTIVDASEQPHVDLEIRVPVPDMEHVPPPPGAKTHGLTNTRTTAPIGGERGIWPALYPALLEEIRAHRSTILFVNSRGQCERLAQRLNDLAGEELVLAHHGSISHARRAEIENALKEGRLRAIVATSSLELGIDMGAVDLVLLVESPGSVARGLQRVGRAGHAVGEVSVGRMYPKFRGDLLESAVIVERMQAGAIEAVRVPANALDVLAQQLVAACCERERSVSELEALVRRAAPYRELTRNALTAVLDMLSGRFPSSDFADLRPRLAWDRASDVLRARRGAELVARLNAGTIPDRGTFAVHLGTDGPRIGELDEEMVYETRDGDALTLGASTWRVEEITRDRVIVSPAPGEIGRLPFWKGDGPGRPLELGRAVGAFTREVAAQGDGAADWLAARLPLDAHAATNLAAYVDEQRAATGVLPTDRAITVERFPDELGDWRVCLLTPFGRALHAPWAMAIEARLSAQSGIDVEVMYTDDGIVLRLADADELPGLDALFPSADEVRELVTERLGRTALFAALFRENAVRALLVPRRRPEERSPLWAQRLKTRALLAAVQGFPDFPIVLETYRQALSDVFDLDGLEEVLRGVETRAIAVDEVETRAPSPFARSLVYAYVAAYLYGDDAPAAERKAQALQLDQGLLQELLGRPALRELIDPAVLAELEEELAGREEHHRARDRDELHDLLRRIGDLTRAEMAERCTQDPGEWLARLAAESRALELDVAGEPRWIAAEDAGLFRDALGCALPPALPAALLAPVERALERLLARFAATRGPFRTRDAAARYGLASAAVEPLLRALHERGVLAHGELRPGGSEPEWCDAEVLRKLKRRTLARLRHEVAPVDAPAFARFLPRWHGIGAERAGPASASAHSGALLEAIARLEGLALPWSALANEILPARVPGFTLDALDLLAATGRSAWIGRGALGPRDGRVALYRRERVALLAEAPTDCEPTSALHATLLARLAERGACFLTELERACHERHTGVATREIEAALWDLVWAGRITNDTFQPLRTLGRAGRPAHSKRAWQGTLAGGRWTLVSELLDAKVGDTERALARAEMLLERHGVVTREAARAEGLAFAPIYKVLRAMEETGRVRRGFFVAALAGAQFALPGAVELLRDVRRASEPTLACLPAVDPANPYGTHLPWPESEGSARRVPGAFVGLLDGRPVWWLAPGRRRVRVFAEGLDPSALPRAFALLHELPRRSRRLLTIEKIDDVPATESPHLAAFLAAGFVRDYRGLVADPGGAHAARNP